MTLDPSNNADKRDQDVIYKLLPPRQQVYTEIYRFIISLYRYIIIDRAGLNNLSIIQIIILHLSTPIFKSKLPIILKKLIKCK